MTVFEALQLMINFGMFVGTLSLNIIIVTVSLKTKK